MTSSKIKSAKGISLISLVITIMILMILANIIIYNVKDDIKLGNLAEMQNDIDILRGKVSSYYVQNGKLPASINYTNIESIKATGVISEAVDTGRFLVIDLSALENLTLNRGKDFEKVKEDPENANSYTDLYIINETSHNIFYAAGIVIDGDVFYTDYTSNNIDTVPVNLRYVENVRIPEGFYYLRGTKEEGIRIKSDDDTEEYEWVQQEEKISEIPDDVEIDRNEEEDFIESVNAYQGYYKSVNPSQEYARSVRTSKVMYLKMENHSPVYDREGRYRDKNGQTAYIPEGFSVSNIAGEDTIHQGLVVKDQNQNEWVWIEVPKSIYTTAKSSEDYENIEKDMQTYASGYQDNNCMDNWYDKEQHGFENSNQYNEWKNNMLKSVYEKGGFYIGRYEVGTDIARTSNSPTEATPIIQADAYPYNYVTCEQAQMLAKSLATEGNTTSLMFGIQWDLVLKDIEVKGAKTQSELKANSTTWGNYLNSSFDVTKKKVQYANSPATKINWAWIDNKFTKSNLSDVLLTTGATNRNKVLNIYDLAGNVWEWTLEGTNDTGKPCSVRSGSSHDNGDTYAVSQRFKDISTDANYSLGFRSVLY